MMTIHTYSVVERAVYEGTALAVSRLTSNPPPAEQIVDMVAGTIMNELAGIIDFGIQPVRFTPQLQRHMWEMAQQQETQSNSTNEPVKQQ